MINNNNFFPNEYIVRKVIQHLPFEDLVCGTSVVSRLWQKVTIQLKVWKRLYDEKKFIAQVDRYTVLQDQMQESLDIKNTPFLALNWQMMSDKKCIALRTDGLFVLGTKEQGVRWNSCLLSMDKKARILGGGLFLTIDQSILAVKDGSVRVFELQSNKTVNWIEDVQAHATNITALQKRISTLVTGARNGEIKVWSQNADSLWKCVATLKGHEQQILKISIEEDKIFSWDTSHRLIQWGLSP